MRSAFILIFMFVLTSLCGQHIPVMTYNIKYDGQKTGPNDWESRREKMISLLKHYNPAILGIQEGLYHQVEFIDKNLDGHTFVGVGRNDGVTKGEYCAIYIDTTLFTIIESNTFWLSKKPEEISIGWDAAMERICTYVIIEIRSSNKKLLVLNTHFDHIGHEARIHSSELIVNKIQEINTLNYPVILMGDFNLLPESGAILKIKVKLDDGKEISKRPLYGPPGTFNGFDSRLVTDRIDYIFTLGLEIESYQHIDDRMNDNKHVSDHLPVMAMIKYFK